MDYLKKTQVKPGEIVRIYLGGRLEGFAKLIRKEENSKSFMHEDNKRVCMQERWLVEWASMDDIDDEELEHADLFTQRALEGKRTHRYIEYIEAKTWETFWSKYGPARDSSTPIGDKPIDNFGDIF